MAERQYSVAFLIKGSVVATVDVTAETKQEAVEQASKMFSIEVKTN